MEKNNRSKKDQLKENIKFNRWDKAFSIAKSFIREFNKDQQRIIQIANECKDESRKNFYIGLGVDIKSNYEQAILILKNYN